MLASLKQDKKKHLGHYYAMQDVLEGLSSVIKDIDRQKYIQIMCYKKIEEWGVPIDIVQWRKNRADMGN